MGVGVMAGRLDGLSIGGVAGPGEAGPRDRDPLDGGAEEGEDLRDAARASLQGGRRLEDEDPAREVDGRPHAVAVGGGGDLEELARVQVQLEDLPVPGALAAAVRAVGIEGDAVAGPVDGGIVGIARPGGELHEKRVRWVRTGHLDRGDHPSLAVVVEEGEVVDLPPRAAVGEEVVGRGEDEAEGPRPRLGNEVWPAARQTDCRGAFPMEREGRTGGQDRENDRETAPGGKQAYQGSRHATATKQEAYPGGRCPSPVTRAPKCPRMRCFVTGPFACGLAQGPDYGLRPHRAGARSAATQGRRPHAPRVSPRAVASRTRRGRRPGGAHLGTSAWLAALWRRPDYGNPVGAARGRARDPRWRTREPRT